MTISKKHKNIKLTNDTIISTNILVFLMVKKSLIRPLKRAPLTVVHDAVCPNLIGLWAGEASCQRATTSRQSSSERRAAVGQEGLQVAGTFVKDYYHFLQHF